MSEAIQVTAHMASPLVVPNFPINLDGLLAAAVCEARGWMPGVGEWHDVEVPLERSSCGRYHLASVGHYEAERFHLGYTHRRPVDGPARMHGGPNVRRLDTSTGKNKGYRIPQPRATVPLIRWWALGESSTVRALLHLVTHLGPKRSSGMGRVGSWDVDPDPKLWDGFPILRPDGTPMRNLPLEIAGDMAAIGWGPLSYPYWETSIAEELAQPPDVGWLGPDETTGAGRWYVTSHAARRLLQRYGGNLGLSTVRESVEWIRKDSMEAKWSKSSDRGGEVWTGARPHRVRYVVGELPAEHAMVPGALPPLVTILSRERRSRARAAD